MNPIPRRSLLRFALRLGAATALAPALIPVARAAESCVHPDSESLRTSLNYAGASPDPAKRCAGCAFFTADTGNPACGNCTILAGPVDPGGSCDSWSPPD